MSDTTEKKKITHKEGLKALAALFLCLVVGPALGFLVAYSIAAFVAWDWNWVPGSNPLGRVLFICFAAFWVFAGCVGMTLAVTKAIEE